MPNSGIMPEQSIQTHPHKYMWIITREPATCTIFISGSKKKMIGNWQKISVPQGSFCTLLFMMSEAYLYTEEENSVGFLFQTSSRETKGGCPEYGSLRDYETSKIAVIVSL